MATFSSQEVAQLIVMEAVATYTNEKAKSGSRSFVYSGVHVQLMDGEGNIYQLELTTKDLPEATYMSDGSMRAMLECIYGKMVKEDKITKDDRITTETFTIPLQGLVGRRVDDFK